MDLQLIMDSPVAMNSNRVLIRKDNHKNRAFSAKRANELDKVKGVTAAKSNKEINTYTDVYLNGVKRQNQSIAIHHAITKYPHNEDECDHEHEVIAYEDLYRDL